MIHLDRPYYRNIRASELKRMYADKHIYFVRVGNTYAAVLSDMELEKGSLHTVSITETQKIPLWKAHQNMMMGKPYRTEKEDVRMYRTSTIPENMENHYAYNAYFVRNM